MYSDAQPALQAGLVEGNSRLQQACLISYYLINDSSLPGRTRSRYPAPYRLPASMLLDPEGSLSYVLILI